ncbi:hypothetical protein [Hydrocarboniphaga sp.]|uniref:hypothetical protein n=1 Tax=Hydrocarboniphaga sp. TaxID=2033016 RepID=UPI003D0E2453
MSFWTPIKTTLALASIGILATPWLRKLGVLPGAQPAATNDGGDIGATGATADNAPPEMTLPYGSNGGGESFSRH